MFVWQKKKKKEKMTIAHLLCSSMKMYFSFQTEWILSWIWVEQTRQFHFFILPKLFLNHSAQIFLFNFFYPSLATIANNSIICIALIAVIKQTQQTPTLCRASSQPHSQLGLYFVSREGDVALCRLKINYGLSGIFFPLQTDTLSVWRMNNFACSLGSGLRDISLLWTWYSFKSIWIFSALFTCYTWVATSVVLLE